MCPNGAPNCCFSELRIGVVQKDISILIIVVIVVVVIVVIVVVVINSSLGV
jgi:hypothetical protein